MDCGAKVRFSFENTKQIDVFFIKKAFKGN